jgi:hypothetical protein
LLYNALVAVIKETLYSISVRRALSAALALDTRTRGLSLVFKSAGRAGLDLLLNKLDLLIYKKWLNFYLSYKRVAC